MTRIWWDITASEDDQRAVLHHLQLSAGFAGVPWAFLPGNVRAVLEQRVRVLKEQDRERRDEAGAADGQC
jgi:hypothetical protein